VMHANHEIGTLQPIREIVERCHARGVLVHTDAAQSVGKVPVRIDELGVDLLSFSGHKMYAPKGIGALYVRRGLALEPLIHGAGHEGGLRSGTENVPYIVGLGRAAELAAKELGPFARLATLRDRLTRQLSEAVGPALSVNAGLTERLPNTLSVNFPETNSREMLRRIPELCASTGAAGHRDAENLTPTLAALGLPPEIARGTVRLSLGRYTTEEEIDRAASLLVNAWDGAKGTPGKR